jgi:hypothetical protein
MHDFQNLKNKMVLLSDNRHLAQKNIQFAFDLTTQVPSSGVMSVFLIFALTGKIFPAPHTASCLTCPLELFRLRVRFFQDNIYRE